MGKESSIPGIFQALAAISEFGGGIALISGFLTRLGVYAK
jgi:putative oxidoreductase